MKTSRFQHSQRIKLGSPVGVVLLAFVLGSVSFTHLDAQQYMKHLGTKESEHSNEMIPTSDGNYVTVGPVTRPTSQGRGSDIYLNKVTPAGVLLWSRRIVDATNDPLGSSVPLSVTETFTGDGPTGDLQSVPSGFAITGQNYNNPEYPVFVVQTDVNGNPLWYKTYGGPIPGAKNLRIAGGEGAKIIYADWWDYFQIWGKEDDERQQELVVCGSVFLSSRSSTLSHNSEVLVGQVPFLLVTDLDGNQRFLKLYHDLSHSPQKQFGLGQRGHFEDVQTVGDFEPSSFEGDDTELLPGWYLTGHFGDFFSSDDQDAAIVLRVDEWGKLDIHNCSGQQITGKYSLPDTDQAIQATAMSEIYSRSGGPFPGNGVHGNLARRIAARVVGKNAPNETVIFDVHSGLEAFCAVMPLNPVLYDSFTTLGGIHKLAGGAGNEFILCGRNSGAEDAALLRILENGNVVFANGYGGSHSEFFTTVEEMPSGDFFASGGTTTWSRGVSDEYLTRTDANGEVKGCRFYPLKTQSQTIRLQRSNPEYKWVDLKGPKARRPKASKPDTLVTAICPDQFIVVPTIPWDWFVRADFNRDMKLDISDPIETLHHLFAGKEASVPEEASDSNADGMTDISDAVYSLLYLFRGGPPPSPPFEDPGPDPKNERVNIFSMEELRELLMESQDDDGFPVSEWLSIFGPSPDDQVPSNPFEDGRLENTVLSESIDTLPQNDKLPLDDGGKIVQ